ncbi:MAG: lipopolysaccharide assembly protein LapA domain-containing protein [Actinomycetota bacterium]
MATERDDFPDESVTPSDGPMAGETPPTSVTGSTNHTGSTPESPRAPDPAVADVHDQMQAMENQVQRTRISATWVAIVIGIVVLVLLLIFILQNLRNVTVIFFGASGQLPLGVALLFATIGGALLVAIVGIARLTQLRLNARRRRRAGMRPRTEAKQ